MAINENDNDLLTYLKKLPFSENEAVTNQRENTIICIMLLARQYHKYKEVIRIITDNSGKNFDDVSQLILTSDLFPTLEIVDD